MYRAVAKLLVWDGLISQSGVIEQYEQAGAALEAPKRPRAAASYSVAFLPLRPMHSASHFASPMRRFARRPFFGITSAAVEYGVGAAGF
jgi:hypothetical protein